MVNKLHRPDPDNVGRHSRPSLQELKSLLFRMSSVFDEVSIVVDALDECKQPRQTSKLLADLATKQSSNIKVILVSREDPQIETHLGSFDKVSISAQSSDLRLFVSAQIQERTEDSRWRIRSTELEAEIIRRLVHGSEGMSVRDCSFAFELS